MENKESDTDTAVHERPRSAFVRLAKIIVFCILVVIITIAGWIKYNMYASPFSPTRLSPKERQVLDSKLAILDVSAKKERSFGKETPHDILKPEPYSEQGARREIQLTEKELNAIIANNPEVAKRVAIDLSDNLVSAKLVVPMDEEIPVLGGKTLRLHMGINLGYKNDQLVVALKGVSLGGIPVPNAWLGNLKDKNLVEEFGSEGGFWQLFSAGVQNITVREGHIGIMLKE
jgi:hypothetical protein